uniref:NAC domain-containing protein 68 n=2 Tax=Anthurium amnicola TaxID=1678845 RepID=A0A1D1Y7L8_9ARAE
MDSFEVTEDTGSDSFRTPESDVENDAATEQDGPAVPLAWTAAPQAAGGIQAAERIKEDHDWFTDLNLDDLQNSFMAIGGMAAPPPPDLSFQDYFFSGLTSPQLRHSHGGGLPPF